MLWKEFGKYGAINSVKVMWPRTEEERNRNRNCGFVSFMERSDAEIAKDEMQGRIYSIISIWIWYTPINCDSLPAYVDFDFFGYEIGVGWGKPVKINPAPLGTISTWFGISYYITISHRIELSLSIYLYLIVMPTVQSIAYSIPISKSKLMF